MTDQFAPDSVFAADDWPGDMVQSTFPADSAEPVDIGLVEDVEVTAPGVVVDAPASSPWGLRLVGALVAGGLVYAVTSGKNRGAYALGAAVVGGYLAPLIVARLRGASGA